MSLEFVFLMCQNQNQIEDFYPIIVGSNCFADFAQPLDGDGFAD